MKSADVERSELGELKSYLIALASSAVGIRKPLGDAMVDLALRICF